VICDIISLMKIPHFILEFMVVLCSMILGEMWLFDSWYWWHFWLSLLK